MASLKSFSLKNLLDYSQNLSPMPSQPPSMKEVAAVILGGGTGSRLFPLTFTRCKPAISFGGRFKLIDIPISNALNSGCNKIFVLSQFLSASLHQHIVKTYRIDNFSQGFLELLSVEQKPSKSSWYKGTADAVRQNIEYLREVPVEYILILSGDQLYKMNFQKMLHFAVSKDADLVVATLPVEKSTAKRMGIMKSDKHHRITAFVEKPEDEIVLKEFAHLKGEKPYLGSMGIYLFKRKALFQLLEEDPREDFGKHLIQTQVKKGNVVSFVHNDYWEDIGTVESFFHANLNLAKPNPLFDCYSEAFPIFSATSTLPGAKVIGAEIRHSILSDGSIIEAKLIDESIIGPRALIGKNSIIEQSYIIGNESYGTRSKKKYFIGKGCHIRKAIIDKNVIIGDGVKLLNEKNLQSYDGDGIYIRDGIIIVTPGTSLPDNFTI